MRDNLIEKFLKECRTDVLYYEEGVSTFPWVSKTHNSHTLMKSNGTNMALQSTPAI